MVMRDNGRLIEAFEHIDRASQLDPLSGVILSVPGQRAGALGRFDEADLSYRQASEIDPTSPQPYGDLANLHAYARNQFAPAVPLMERAAALDSGNPMWVCLLAVLQLDLTDTPAAKRLIVEAARRWPDDFFSNACAAAFNSTLGDHAAAAQHARKALVAWPKEYWSLSILRDADLRNGNATAARERYASAYPELLSPVTPQVDTGNYYSAIDLTLVLQATGELDRARASAARW